MQTAQSMFVIDFKIVISITIDCRCEFTTIDRYILKVLLCVCLTNVESVKFFSKSQTVTYKIIFIFGSLSYGTFIIIKHNTTQNNNFE